MNTGAGTGPHPSDLENSLSKRKYKLKTKNVLSQIDSIRKNQVIINKPNDVAAVVDRPIGKPGDSSGLGRKI